MRLTRGSACRARRWFVGLRPGGASRPGRRRSPPGHAPTTPLAQKEDLDLVTGLRQCVRMQKWKRCLGRVVGTPRAFHQHLAHANLTVERVALRFHREAQCRPQGRRWRSSRKLPPGWSRTLARRIGRWRQQPSPRVRPSSLGPLRLVRPSERHMRIEVEYGRLYRRHV